MVVSVFVWERIYLTHFSSNFRRAFKQFSGNTPCSIEVPVNVKVIDRSMPVFDKQFYTDSVLESIEIHSPLALSIQAESPLNRKLIYSITKGNDFEEFALDFNTGKRYHYPGVRDNISYRSNDEIDVNDVKDYRVNPVCKQSRFLFLTNDIFGFPVNGITVTKF